MKQAPSPAPIPSARRRAASWIAAGAGALGLAGCIFLDWSVPSGGADGGACGDASTCDDQNDCTADACDSASCTHTPLPSGTACASGGGTVCDGAGTCVGGAVLWARTFKGASGTSMSHVVVDPSGDVSLVGSISGAIDLGGGSMTTGDGGLPSLGVASYDGDGTYRFSTVRGADGASVNGEGSSTDTQGFVVAAASLSGGTVDFGQGKITGTGATSLVLAQYAPDAGAVYAKGYPTSPADAGVAPSSLAGDPSGNAYVLGAFAGSLTIGSSKLTSGNHFVAAFDNGGTPHWATSFTEATEVAPTLTVDPLNGVLVTGAFIGTLDLGSTTYDKSSMTAAIFVARLGLSDGKVDLAKSFPVLMGNGVGIPTSIAVDTQGNILLAGALTGPITFGNTPTLNGPGDFIVKLDPTGTPVWAHSIGTDTTPAALYVAASGTDIILAGAFQSPIDFGDGKTVASQGKRDAYVARYDGSGKLLYEDIFGDPEDQTVTGLAVGPDGSIFVSGDDQGMLTFDGKILPDAGTPGGLFLVKLAP